MLLRDLPAQRLVGLMVLVPEAGSCFRVLVPTSKEVRAQEEAVERVSAGSSPPKEGLRKPGNGFRRELPSLNRLEHFEDSCAQTSVPWPITK